MKRTGILLENDTNELEIVEFRVDEIDGHGTPVPCHYGINVAKVREIIRLPPISCVVNAKPGVEGMIRLRDKVVTVLNLATVLGKDTGGRKAECVVVLEFNNITVGVMVHAVSRIYRISWANVEPPSTSLQSSRVTGLVKMDDRINLVLDFERIVGELCAESALKPLTNELITNPGRGGKTIVVADDSAFIRQTISGTLRSAGYTVEEAVNGLEAWDILRSKAERCTQNGSNIKDAVSLLITDVEMPQMDGLHLTSKVRGEKTLNGLPVVIFSSLASEDNRRKWIDLGADHILTKPELPQLVEVTDALTA